ncbi:hypothetical protein [Sphingobacterium thalpophilum]|uniref:hypothetical protein n=1 Tax=Sphingobacterium thalpophilum TaxID=259 RepID=UPI003D988104
MKLEANENLPENRLMFEHNLYLVVEMAMNSRLHFSKRAQNHGLDKVRRLPNGRLDLHTINESARVIMNMFSRQDSIDLNEKK